MVTQKDSVSTDNPWIMMHWEQGWLETELYSKAVQYILLGLRMERFFAWN